MKNKIFSVLLIALLLLQSAVMASTFTDVEGHWAEPYVKQMTDIGYINGYGDGTFGPDAFVTRADALILAARVLGLNEKDNAEFIDSLYKVYEKDVKDLGYAGYEKGFSRLLYNDIYSVEELTEFVGNALGTNPLKRYEAAILLVKLIGQEEAVLENTMPMLDYDDANEIPVNAQAYVEFCAQSGLMNGVGDNKFSPETEVTRGQIAKMLCSVIETLDISYANGVVTGYDDKTKEVTYTDKNGDDVTLEILSHYIVKKDGVDVLDTSVINKDDKIHIVCKGDNVVSVGFVSPAKSLSAKGIYLKYNKTEDGMYVDIKPGELAETSETYKVAPDCKVIFLTREIDVESIPPEAYVEYEVKDGVVVYIYAIDSETWREGYIKSFIYGSPSMLEITLEDGTVEKYQFDETLKVMNNGVETPISKLGIGDKVVLGVYLNKIRLIDAKPESSEIEGTIKKITISATQPSITISTESGDKAYSLSGSELSLTMKDKNISIYDLRLGYKVNVTLQGKTAVKINVTEATVTEKYTLTGTVSNVDTAYKNITIKDADGNENIVFVNETTVIIDSKTGQAVQFENIPSGVTVISIVSPEKLNNVAISIAIITE